MIKRTIPALTAIALLGGLAACGDGAEQAADSEAVADGESLGAASDGTSDVDVTVPEIPAEDTEGDSFSVSEDGVQADINGGDTSVRADIDENPSMSVETN